MGACVGARSCVRARVFMRVHACMRACACVRRTREFAGGPRRSARGTSRAPPRPTAQRTAARKPTTRLRCNLRLPRPARREHAPWHAAGMLAAVRGTACSATRSRAACNIRPARAQTRNRVGKPARRRLGSVPCGGTTRAVLQARCGPSAAWRRVPGAALARLRERRHAQLHLHKQEARLLPRAQELHAPAT